MHSNSYINGMDVYWGAWAFTKSCINIRI